MAALGQSDPAAQPVSTSSCASREGVLAELSQLPADPFDDDIDSDSDAELELRMRGDPVETRMPLTSPEEEFSLVSVGPVAASATQGASPPARMSSLESVARRMPRRNVTRPRPSLTCWLHEKVAAVQQLRWVPSSDAALASAESAMLEPIAGLYEQRLVQTPVCEINTITHICHNPSLRHRHIVLLHGFGFGLAQWVPNWVTLAAQGNVHAIDLPGFARSGRPPLSEFCAQEAILFFIQTVEEWLKLVVLAPHDIARASTACDTQGRVRLPQDPEVILVGHSFGGYIAAKYAANYPHRVSTVILADAFGIKNTPDDVVEQFHRDATAAQRLALWAAKKLFYSVNPLCVLRGAGPLGPALLAKKKRRMAIKWKPFVGGDGHQVLDYVYHANAQNPTGEKVFSLLVEGIGEGIGEGWNVKFPAEKELLRLPESVRLIFINGEWSWIPSSAAADIAQARNAQHPGARSAAAAYIVHKAGHHVHSDGTVAFNAILEKELSRDLCVR